MCSVQDSELSILFKEFVFISLLSLLFKVFVLTLTVFVLRGDWKRSHVHQYWGTSHPACHVLIIQGIF